MRKTRAYQSEANGATQTSKPHDHLHLERNALLPAPVRDIRQREYVEDTGDQAEHSAEEEEGEVDLRVLAREHAHADVQKHEVLAQHRHALEDVVRGNLRGGGEVVAVVVREHDAAEEQTHDAAQLHCLRERKAPVRK